MHLFSRLAVAGCATLLTGLLSPPAVADGLSTRDPYGDTALRSDLTDAYSALNQDVVSVTLRPAGQDEAWQRAAVVRVDLDTDGDGATDFTMRKGSDGSRALLDRRGAAVPGCPVAGSTGLVTLSTDAHCVGSPRSVGVRVSYRVGGDRPDLVPDGGGFSAPVSRDPLVTGATYDYWQAHGGAYGRLGLARTDTAPTAHDGTWTLFGGGVVLWSPPTGAHLVSGGIREGFAQLGAEWGLLGLPTTEELGTSGRPGAVQLFQGASLYWSWATGAHEVYGAVREAWAGQGYEGGRLGFPTSGEHDAPGGRAQEFQGGRITWTPEGGAVVTYV